MTLWDVPDLLTELYENWAEMSNLLRVPSGSGVIDSLDFVLCGDASVPLRLQALAIVFRARMYTSFFFILCFCVVNNSVSTYLVCLGSEFK